MEKTLLPTIRHSKQLVEAIKKARSEHSGAQQSLEAGKWYIKDGEAILGGPSDTQWAAWMEAAYGKSSNQ